MLAAAEGIPHKMEGPSKASTYQRLCPQHIKVIDVEYQTDSVSVKDLDQLIGTVPERLIMSNIPGGALGEHHGVVSATSSWEKVPLKKVTTSRVSANDSSIFPRKERSYIWSWVGLFVTNVLKEMLTLLNAQPLYTSVRYPSQISWY